MTKETTAADKGGASSDGQAAQKWFAMTSDEVVQQLGVDLNTGVPASDAAERLKQDGPNALPAEEPPAEWKMFLVQYKSYMQIILVGAAVAS